MLNFTLTDKSLLRSQMSRSRSRSRERKKDKRRDRKRSRDKRSRSRDRDRKSRSRGRDYKRRDRSYSREKYSRKRDRSYEQRSRDKSHERHRDKRRDSRDRRHRSSSSNERNSNPRSTSVTSSSVIKPIIIAASHIKRSKLKRQESSSSEAKIVDHRKSFEISNEFSQEGFEQFSRDHGIDFSKIETEEDRQDLHAKMEDVLKEHFAAQGKVYPPPKPEVPAVNAATGFANDGSFLEQFKKMQDEYKQQLEEEKRRKAAEDRLKALPLRRRGGGKILKTGIVAKTIANPDNQQPQPSSTDAFSLYFKELQKYKSTSCDGDSKTRPLVK